MYKKRTAALGIIMLLVLIGSILLMYNNSNQQIYSADSNPSQKQEIKIPQTVETSTKYKLTDAGFHKFFESLSLPRTLELFETPPITGNQAADKVIATTAKQRGYLLRRVVSDESDLKTVDNGQRIQTLAVDSWNSLKSAAKTEGIDLSIIFGYRSVEDQTKLFNYELSSTTPQLIAEGNADSIVIKALSRVAPPGYSRHHNGYTVDLKSADSLVFSASRGFAWLSGNNYENAKKFGFIPSYPSGAVDQGPEPEAWEYIWIGKEVIAEQIQP